MGLIHTLALDLINPEIERRRQVKRPSAGPGCNVSRKRRNCAVRKAARTIKPWRHVANVAQRCVAGARR